MNGVHLETIQTWLVTQLAGQLGMVSEHLDIRKPITEYGLDSITGVSLAGDLEDWLRLQLSPTLLWDYPTIETLAQHLAKEVNNQAVSAHHGLSNPFDGGDGNLSPEHAAQLLSKLDDLSDTDIDSLLDGLLAA